MDEADKMSNGKIFQKHLGVTVFLLISIFSQTNAADLTITWDPNSEADLKGYKVYYGTTSRNYSTIIDVGNTTTYLATNLTDGVEYFFSVTAYDTANNESNYSKEVSAIAGVVDTIPPSPPSITGYEVKRGIINISWINNTEEDLAGYRIYYGISSGNYPNKIDVGNVTNYAVPDLKQGVSYFFVLTAYDIYNNESNYSNEISVTIPVSDTIPPSAPIISGYSIQQKKVHLSWQGNNEPDLSGYKVYYGLSSKNYSESIDVGKATSYTTTDLLAGEVYFFAVTAYDTANNESEFSTEISVSIPTEDSTPPQSPTISKLELKQRKVIIYWNGITEPDLKGYKVYYGMSSRNYDVVIDVANVTNYTTPNLSEGVMYFFAVTAYDTAGNESEFSNEMSTDVPVIDITPPTIYAVEIRDSITVILIFSEPVERTSAEELSNYHIDNNIQILQASLDENERMVHLTTTPHKSGITYTLAVSNIHDLAESPNTIKPNTTCTYQYNPEDHTPPVLTKVEILDATHVNVTFSEEIDRTSAEIVQNYAIDNGITILDAILDVSLRVVHLTTTAHQNNTTYTLTVNNIKDRAPIPNIIVSNSTISYTYYAEDTTPPAIYSAEIRSETEVNVIFTEQVEQTSAENIENYLINNGIIVLTSKLDNNLQVVHLTTSPHSAGITYVIAVQNVKDRAYPPNIIASNNTYTYTYMPEDTTPPKIILVDIKDGTHVDVTFSEDIERESAENEGNYNINNGISVIDAYLDNNYRIVHLITTSHQSGQTYVLTVNNIKDRAPVPNIIDKNSMAAYTYIIEDITPPTITNVIAIDATSVEVTFSEIVDRLSSETIENYSINNGIQILTAELYEDLKTVYLSTTEHESDKSYILTVNNIKDRANPPNTIESNSTFEYSYISGTNSSSVIVSDINPHSYQISYLKQGDFYYIDRSYIIKSIPRDYQGLLWIKTANEDRANKSEKFLSFELHKDAKIYIAYDSRAQSVPNWLLTNFHPLNRYIGVSEYAEKLQLWEKDCIKGTIILGGNYAEGAESMYVVLIEVYGATQPPQPNDTSDPASLGPANVFLLYQNYPNPFNSGTEIRFQLPEDCYVTLTIYNIIGQEVKRLVQGYKQASHHIIRWDGKNSYGRSVPSGVYFSRLEVVRKTKVNDKNIQQVVYNDVRKMILLK